MLMPHPDFYSWAARFLLRYINLSKNPASGVLGIATAVTVYTAGFSASELPPVRLPPEERCS